MIINFFKTFFEELKDFLGSFGIAIKNILNYIYSFLNQFMSKEAIITTLIILLAFGFVYLFLYISNKK